jgi:hypothetical protein
MLWPVGIGACPTGRRVWGEAVSVWIWVGGFAMRGGDGWVCRGCLVGGGHDVDLLCLRLTCAVLVLVSPLLLLRSWSSGVVFERHGWRAAVSRTVWGGIGFVDGREEFVDPRKASGGMPSRHCSLLGEVFGGGSRKWLNRWRNAEDVRRPKLISKWSVHYLTFCGHKSP